jgi:hypothetical protein
VDLHATQVYLHRQPNFSSVVTFMALPKFQFLFPPPAAGQGDIEAVKMLAFQIVTNPKISMAGVHVSGVQDNATARSEAFSQMFGKLAGRSHYADGKLKSAPGGAIMLDVRMLRSLLELARHYRFSIAELAGGCHQTTAHCRGVAFDVNQIDSVRVGSHHPRCADFMENCRELGAIKVYGPLSMGPAATTHKTHVHAQWA